jgi:hypothetical protein
MLAQFFWTYLVGPVAALLPVQWRNALPMAERVHWARAAAVSGLLEGVAGMVAVGYRFMETMTPMIDAGTDTALHGRFGGREVTDHQLTGLALIVFAAHPLTWLYAYAFLEGALRLFGAAFTENPLGIFPLYLLRRVLLLVLHPKEENPVGEIRRNVASIVETAREQMMVARLKKVPDELHYSKNGEQEVLEIHASRRKEDWVAPRIVRVDEAYYRLDESSVERGPRPFRYRLTRLAAGVPGRTVILYKSEDAIVKQ